jgi:hypothetical protein
MVNWLERARATFQNPATSTHRIPESAVRQTAETAKKSPAAISGGQLACSGCKNLRMAEVPAPGLLPPYRFVWGCAKGHLEHGHTTPDLRMLAAPDSCLAAGDHEPAFAKQGETA